MADAIRYEAADGVAVITIDRPEVRNAIDRPTAEAISAALDRLDEEREVTVGILTGAGGGFSAGMDLKALRATGERPVAEPRGAFGIVRQPPDKPLIAAVEGPALGGGCEIALACDLIVASSEARFGLPEVKLGLVAAAGGVIRLPQRIPQGLAMEAALTGEPIPAVRAHELGLVNRVTEPGAALDGARELASAVAAAAPLAVRTSKRIIRESRDVSLAEAFELQAPLIDEIRTSADAAEGTKAFVEKRKPEWRGE